MKTAKSTIIVLILVLLTVGAARPAEDSTKAETPATPLSTEISNTRAANCLVKITCDRGMLPLYIDTIDYLLRSSGVGGKAARDVLGTPLGHEFFEITELPLDVAPDALGGVGLSPTRSPTFPGQSSEFYYFEDSAIQPGSTSTTGSSPGTSAARPTSSRSGGSRPPTNSPATTSRYRRTASTGGYSAYYSRPRTTTTPTRPTPIAATPPTPPIEQTFFFQLKVRLPDEAKPVARQFMDALIENLRQVLTRAFERYREELTMELRGTALRRGDAEGQLATLIKNSTATEQASPIGLNPIDQAVYEQLDEIVDLSALGLEIPFDEALRRVTTSVDPPLKMVVLWSDLYENGDIEPKIPINMDGPSAVRLGTGLEMLLNSVSGGFTDLGYVVQDGVITIATVESLPHKLETRVYDVPGLLYATAGAHELAELIQQTIEPDSWRDVGGEGQISVHLDGKLVVLQSRDIHIKIQNLMQELLKGARANTYIAAPPDVPVEILVETKYNLLGDKQNLEMEVARLTARLSAIEQQIANTNRQIETKIADDRVTAELQRLVDMHVEQLENAKRLVEAGRASSGELTDMTEKLTRARIELLQRREQLSKSLGGDQLTKFNSELADIMIDLAEKRAELQVVSKQLRDAEGRLAAATTFDPEVAQMRLARQEFEVLDRRLSELKTRLTALRPPTVTVLGVD